jgi:hypothetical protein
MRRIVSLLIPLAVAATLALWAGSAPAELGPCKPTPSPVIFPQQTIPLSFSHKDHLAQKLSCDFCHENAPDSTSSADNNIPTEETCTTCHEIDRSQPTKQVAAGEPDAKCDSCHPGWDGQGQPPRVIVPAPNLKFNHKAHVDRKVRCQECHGDLAAEGVDLATREQLPHMPLCLTCHDGKKAQAKCTTCHLGVEGGMVKTEYDEGKLIPTGVLRGDAHDLRFRTDHAKVGADEKYCVNCHKKDFCVSCHDGVQKPLDFHGNDYITLHPIDARRNTPDCTSCHRLQSFCTGCHSRAGVTEDAKTSEFQRTPLTDTDDFRANRFHPRGWFEKVNAATGRFARKATHHSFQAQRNIRTCTSCHREEFCQSCHSADEDSIDIRAVSPHPIGWAGSARCEALRGKNERVCYKCHVEGRTCEL